eukprot:TRINITY_DN11399_c0_g1_i2.p1 TRINITY_DN11399_c0_g1~~TRINITY_DN11399_c0_g1_i2.p1  ORF type:complete len:679 (+),score=206.33 TRINITY_DN11399_c0_g1_i2:147-2183(+)
MLSTFRARLQLAKKTASVPTVGFSNTYSRQHARSIDPTTREQFWSEQAQAVNWIKSPTKILDSSRAPLYRWFTDGLLNTSYNCLDRHVGELGNSIALYWDSPLTNSKAKFTYNQLLDKVATLAGVYTKLGITKGDRVIIYMPQIPEAIFAMLACARIGATHSVVFGGFAPKELASRITDAEPKLIVTSSCGVEPNRVIDYKIAVDEALKISQFENKAKVIVVQRDMMPTKLWTKGRDFDFNEEMNKANKVDPVPVESTHPLYVLYTSGTTGTPKGIVRDNGGTNVALNWSMKHIMGIGKRDVYFSGSDIGWVVGHSFIVYGPLMAGASTILYEGKPIGTPDPGAYWRMVQEYKIKGIYTSPTALRAIRKEDHEGNYFKKYDLSSLDTVTFAGERADIPTLQWLRDNLPKNVLLNDNYWQTESGWPISCNYRNFHTFPTKFGSATRPAPGYEVHILTESHEIIEEKKKLGAVCIKLPLPPSGMMTLWRNDEAFIQKYLSEHPGYYTSGDAGYYDEDGYLHITARVDDVINTAGHRLSTSQMEEVLNSYSDIAESAVVSHRDDLKGEVPVGFVVVKSGRGPNPNDLERALIKLVRTEIGPVAVFKNVIVVEKLPKTRSGKILRATLKKIVDGQKYKITPTIEDETVLPVIETLVKQKGLGKAGDIKFEEDLGLGVGETKP